RDAASLAECHANLAHGPTPRAGSPCPTSLLQVSRCEMSEICPECGAAVPDGGSCRDHFHALLLLEGEIPGVAGSILHFYAVATYGLQHPDSMNYTAESLTGLRAAVADALDGRATVGDLRRRSRRHADGRRRV